MRRKDREMPEEFAMTIIDKCQWAVISMIDRNGMPYGIPISIVRENNIIYFHTAKQGHKIDALTRNQQVCISCVGNTCPIPNQFTIKYESAVIRGIASEVTDDKEKIHALKILCQHHTPTNMHEFDSVITKSLNHTGVWKIQMTEMTGKQNF